MEEKVFFKNSKGDKLCGILNNYQPNKNQPIIILVHGFNSQKNTKNYLLLRNLLEKKGYATFRFDIFGHGESEGKFEDLTISEAVDDIFQAIKFVKSQGYSTIGLVGGSFGGGASEIVASKTNSLSVLVLKSPLSSYMERARARIKKEEIIEWKAKGFRMVEDDGKVVKLNYGYYEDFIDKDGYRVAKSIRIPTFIVHGDKDQSVPVVQSKKIAKLIPNCTLLLINGADHQYSQKKHHEEMSRAMAEFIFKNIDI